jgi:hypothetical protein
MKYITIAGMLTMTGCAVFSPYSDKSYDISEEQTKIEVTELQDQSTKDYLNTFIETPRENTAVDTILDSYKSKYEKKIKEICNIKGFEKEEYCARTAQAFAAAPIVSGLASLASEQLIKQVSKSIQIDQERHSATYQASIVAPLLLMDKKENVYKLPDDPIYRNIKITRSTGTHAKASEIIFNYVLTRSYDKEAYDKLDEFGTKYLDKQLEQQLPKAKADIASYQKKLQKIYTDFLGLAKRNYTGVLTPASLELESSAAKIYSVRWWSWIPPFWYQIFFDPELFNDDLFKNNVKITGKIALNNAELKFDLPTYDLTSGGKKDYSGPSKTWYASYPLSFITYSQNPKFEVSITETDPAEIKAIGDTFNDVAPKVKKELLDALDEKLKKL